MPAPDELSILLVEDDDVDVMSVQRAFERGHIASRVTVARDGIEALRLLRNGQGPQQRRLVLLDLNLPRMSGIEFLGEVRRDPLLCRTLVVVLTTSNEERDRADAYGLHAAGYLLKPVTFPAFVELMVVLNRYWRLVEFP